MEIQFYPIEQSGVQYLTKPWKTYGQNSLLGDFGAYEDLETSPRSCCPPGLLGSYKADK